MNIVIEGSENIDSLPYVDDEITENERIYIQKLIDEEKATFSPPDYLSQLPQHVDIDYKSFNFLENDFKRMEENRKMDEFDINRYKVTSPTGANIKNEKIWNESLNNARSQLEHQDIRKINLELLQRYGANSWKLYLSDLELLQKILKKQLEQKKAEIEEVNIQRKIKQEDTIEKIRQHENKWLNLVYKNKEIELACQSVQREIDQLKIQKEKEEKE
ncbi:hypothetical protein DICPUDRAFT_86122 [Dictyostelium purpureum]|uniref:Pre-mRNA-splicing factor SPF27 n=1 Tax=Dictyostelium purpureum TaxID=5786 RepID=F0Z9L4_DICPU|nr:uncharacterized protein DICPUDRAFT_86122 [Dictyostelium purpureum]EGC39319.1 hypothetical protein DICPUDRAFT_86122 [Dictyostelium purpureum]|eukprot:XP_003284107.1 hypothetical protein DICPUDRAFT_86122 [Dictyostelium purpureum]